MKQMTRMCKSNIHRHYVGVFGHATVAHPEKKTSRTGIYKITCAHELKKRTTQRINKFHAHDAFFATSKLVAMLLRNSMTLM